MPNSWILGLSESGWMRSDTFYEYVANGLDVWLTENEIERPVLFFVDGHKSHLLMPLSEFCSANGIILYSLPPNTTHIMQPADVGAFKGLKSDFKMTVRAWQSRDENLGKAVTKTNFCQLLESVLNEKDRTQIVKNAFRKCGLFPLDPNAVDYSKCVQDHLETISNKEPSSSNDSYSKAQYDSAKQIIESIKEELFTSGIDYQKINEILSLKCQSTSEDYEPEIAEENEEIEGTYLLGHSGELVKISSEISDTISAVSDNADVTLVPAEDEVGNNLEDITNTLDNRSPTTREGLRGLVEFTNTIKISKPTNVSEDFEKQLSYPQPLASTSRRKPQDKAPMSVSSEEWKKFYHEKEQRLLLKVEEVRRNKEQRMLNKIQRDALKNKKPKKNSKKKSKIVRCPECDDEVLTDVEDDGLKNLGCDQCERWFHLHCTTLSNVAFDEAETRDFLCKFCT